MIFLFWRGDSRGLLCQSSSHVMPTWACAMAGIYGCGCIFPSLLLDEKSKIRRSEASQWTEESRPTSRAYRTWRPWLVSPSNHPSPMSAGPTRPTRSVFGVPTHGICCYRFLSLRRTPTPCRHGGQGSAISHAPRTQSCRRFASSRGTQRSIYDRFM